MNWNHEFEARAVTTPEEAVTCVQSGDTVLSGIIEPYFLLKALASRTDLHDVHVLNFAPVKGACFEFTNPELQANFRVTIAVASPLTVEAVNNGTLDFLPVDFTNALTLFKTHLVPDVMFIQVTPPDANGFCNLGLGADYTRPAVSYMKEQGKPVVAEVNDCLPSPMGDCRIHVTDIDRFVVVEEELRTDQKWTEPPPTGPVIDDMADHLDSMIENGSTIEVGIGRVPGALARRMTHKRDLGIHTEVFADALFELVKAGAITGRYKTVLPDQSVATILQGSAEVMEWASNNPSFILRSADFVLDPAVIAANHKMVAINSAIQVDLSGQICAESRGFYQLSTTGGQAAVMHGASLSPEGKAIIAIESTAGHGRISRIVNALDPGAAVTTVRSDIGYVITEYGIAAVAGKSLRERAKALISIAHPDFRDELTAQARARGLKV
jgi:4-hydroxybutyrate CoA-transferase